MGIIYKTIRVPDLEQYRPEFNEDGTEKHICCDGARFHIVRYDKNGPRCSEPNCEVNRFRKGNEHCWPSKFVKDVLHSIANQELANSRDARNWFQIFKARRHLRAAETIINAVDRINSEYQRIKAAEDNPNAPPIKRPARQEPRMAPNTRAPEGRNAGL